MFHAHWPAAAKDRSLSDDIVRGTATELDAADLRPGLTDDVGDDDDSIVLVFVHVFECIWSIFSLFEIWFSTCHQQCT